MHGFCGEDKECMSFVCDDKECMGFLVMIKNAWVWVMIKDA